jgi:hypothetical protein
MEGCDEPIRHQIRGPIHCPFSPLNYKTNA